MATLQELMAECGLGDAPKGQTKTANEKPSSEEVNKVLADLGLDESALAAADGVTKVAGDERNDMSLTEIYGKMFGEDQGQPEETTVTKTASSEEDNTNQDADDSVFASLAGAYFSEMVDSTMDKLAADLEAEAGAGHNPLPEHTGGQLTTVIGKPKDPHLPVNHKGNADAKLETNNAKTPYTFAAVQAYLKRLGGSQMLVGAQK